MKFLSRIAVYILLIVFALFSSCSEKKTASDILSETYTKKEYRIPMRDGITLFTVVYTPKSNSEKYPLLLMRTPYGVSPYGESIIRNIIAPSESFIQEGYIFVFQDVRGRFMSEGTYENMRPFVPNKNNVSITDESSDTYDTIDWLINNIDNNNGKVGQWGSSYPGFYTIMGALSGHPNLVAVSPQAPIADWFIGDDFHHNGAFSLLMAFNFFQRFGIPRENLTTTWPVPIEYPSPDAYTFFLKMGSLQNVNKNYFRNAIPFWDSLMLHGTYDYFWKERNILPHLNNINPAVLTVGGWFDSEDLYGPLNVYRVLEANDSLNKNFIVMGPWTHGHWINGDGDSLDVISFDSKTTEFYREHILEKFFKYYLKEKGTLDLLSAYMFNTGSNEWSAYNFWPPENIRTLELFLDGNGAINFETGGASVKYTEFISDPENPVPYTSEFVDSRRFYRREYMIEDQRFAFSRPDVISFQTEPLNNDITLAGPVEAELFVSTSGTDADWVVKLIDVYPDDHENPDPNPSQVEMGGYQRLVRYEILRGKFRNNYELPEPFMPNSVTKLSINLNDAFHTFRKGHRIMVQIQSSMFPFFDRNPQRFVDIYNADENDFNKAYHRVYHSGDYPSRILLKITD